MKQFNEKPEDIETIFIEHGDINGEGPDVHFTNPFTGTRRPCDLYMEISRVLWRVKNMHHLIHANELLRKKIPFRITNKHADYDCRVNLGNIYSFINWLEFENVKYLHDLDYPKRSDSDAAVIVTGCSMRNNIRTINYKKHPELRPVITTFNFDGVEMTPNQVRDRIAELGLTPEEARLRRGYTARINYVHD